MAYEKLGFVDKETPLDAAHFNHMEGGIETANSVLETTTTNEITWDGVVGDRFVIDPTGNGSMFFVRVSDQVPPKSVFVEQGFSLTTSQNPDKRDFSAENAASLVHDVNDKCYNIQVDGAAFVVLEDGTGVDVGDGSILTFEHKGVYFMYFEGDSSFYTSLSSPLLSVPTTKIKKSALPDDIGVSWNDLTDRPFYTEEVVVLEEQTLDFSTATDSVIVLPDLDVSAGDQLTVMWNGVSYDCTVLSIMGSLGFGNFGLVDFGDDTGEPFVIIKEGAWAVLCPSGGEVIVEIIKSAITKLPEQYLPESATRELRINVTVGENDEIVADKTLSEIQKAVSAGAQPIVYLHMNANITHVLHLCGGVGGVIFMFSSVNIATAKPVLYHVQFDEQGVYVSMYELATATT